MELRCSRELALRLGAVEPVGLHHHRQLRSRGDLLMRDTETAAACFWRLMLSGEDLVAARSS